MTLKRKLGRQFDTFKNLERPKWISSLTARSGSLKSIAKPVLTLAVHSSLPPFHYPTHAHSLSTQIFIADLEEVESLPRHATMHHLERIGADVCISYLEHIIHHLGEEGAEFHEKLIELYLAEVHSTHSSTSRLLFSLLRQSNTYSLGLVPFSFLGNVPQVARPAGELNSVSCG